MAAPITDTTKPYDLSLFAKFADKHDLISILQPIQNCLVQEIGQLSELIESNDWISVGKLAHRLKSSVGYLKAKELLETLITIESYAKDLSLADQLPALVGPMQRQAENIVAHLAIEIKGLHQELAVAC